MGRADTVAVSDGGEPLDGTTHQAGERLGLGLTQLREPLGHVGDRTVVLAQLLPRGRRLDGGDEAVRW